MTVKLYQAKAGDGIKKRGIKRSDSFFRTPEEAVSEALGLKERIDKKYKNEIHWDYEGKITGSIKKMKILRGYIDGNRKSHPFYLEILSIEQKDVPTVSPLKPKKMSAEDQKVLDNVVRLFN
ncbi:hypothetical protein [Bacillus methanolicus]|uniref:Uncharacterized protein n=1 Tax=Bacillus methanolicus (strain MGA3 / ATCC 53907) TaxID=796606 RepID=I3E8C9_BACMM|nr:hypothetical protein [Bacillus methanolicus]AIE60022.1 hypothetical protein BMMGA3_08080 [Bacillus methanolicus MGA3]EIJ82750.1 hypothetical protein MGA3_05955 [Bacillus methanolicus MGA3]UQD52026.1 hypothetical protein C0971_08365 [Bacillus methanolicus]